MNNLFHCFLSSSFISALLIVATILPIGQIKVAKAQGTPGLMEFRWNNDSNYRKLYYYLSSTQPDDLSTWYLTLRSKDRKTAFLKLTITLPDYLDSKLKEDRIALCRISMGNMMSRTKCIEEIPATISVSSDQSSIEIYPDVPVSKEGDYALQIKLFNPKGSKMYQLNALIQPPGDIPISTYVGSWLIDMD